MAISLQALTVQALVFTLVYYVVKYRYLHPLRTYPGPLWASLSNTWKFYHYMKGDLNIIEQDLHEKHGAVLRTGPTTLSFSSLAAFDAIYEDSPGLEKGDFYGFARQPRTGEYNVFSARSRTEHQRRRQLVSAAFTTLQVQKLEPVITRHVQYFLSTIENARAGSGNEVVNVAQHVQALVMNSMIEIIFGPRIAASGQPWTETASGEGILSAFRAAAKFGWGLSYLPALANFMAFKPVHSWLRKATLNADGVAIGISGLSARGKQLILEELESITGVEQASIAKTLLLGQKGGVKNLDPLDVYNECFNLLFMGPGSTTAAITQCLYRLGSKDGLEWQRQIRKDLDTSGDPSSSMALDAVISETLRHSTPFTAAFPREVRSEKVITIPGIQAPLPLGTIVAASTWIIGHDDRYWGDDALQWKPERWVYKGNNDQRAIGDRDIAFGKGPRSCLGKEIALSLMTQTIAAVLTKWQIACRGELYAGAWLETQVDRCELVLTEV